MQKSAQPRLSDPSCVRWSERVAQSFRRWFSSPPGSDLESLMSEAPATSVVRHTRAGDEYRL
jgi:hypothetical protein